MIQLPTHYINFFTKSIVAALFLCSFLISCEIPTAQILEGTTSGVATEVSYTNLSGNQKTIPVDDVAGISVGAFIKAIKVQAGIVNSYCNLVVGLEAYEEEDTRPLAALLNVATTSKSQLTVIVMPNVVKAQRLLGDNYLGIEAWQKLGLTAEEREAIEIPTLSDAMLAEIKRLQDLEQQPMLVLDLGDSMATMEKRCAKRDIPVLSNYKQRDRRIRQQSYYRTPGPAYARWLLLPGSDDGTLPGSRNKRYDDQVQYQQEHYPGYVVGRIRELVLVAMLQYVQNGTVLWDHAYTRGRCKEQFKNGNWQGYSVLFLEPSRDQGGILVFGDVGAAQDIAGLFCVLAAR